MEWHAPWDIRVTLDLFLGGLGVGIFLLSVLLTVSDKNRNRKLAAMGAYLAPVLVTGGLVLLMSELGRPLRFINTIYNFNPLSVTSWGGPFQAIFIVLSIIYAWLHFRNKTSGPLFRAILGIGTIFALLVGVYHGLLLASLGRPLWVGGTVITLFLVSSLLGGIALLMLIKELSISFGVSKEVRSQVAAAAETQGFNFTILFCVLSALQLILVLSWQFTLSRGGMETATAAKGMMDQFGGLWIGLVLIGGLALPFLGSLYSIIKDRTAEMSKGLALTLATFVIVGGFAFKHIVLLAGQIKLTIPF